MAFLFGPVIQKIRSSIKQPLQETFRYQSLFRKRSQKETQLSPYIVLRATNDDYYPILQLMHEAYYPDEPTCTAIGVKKNAFLDEAVMKEMAEGMTLVARCKYDGCIVGAAINSSAHPWDPDVTEKLACSIQCPTVKQLLLFHAYVQRTPELWKCYEVQKVLELAYAFVKPGHRRKGIGYKLMKESLDLGADCGYGLIRCDATSTYYAKICEKLNMKMIAEIPYCSYLGKNLEPIFNPPHPHKAVKIYVADSPQTLHLTQGKKKRKNKMIEK